MSGRVWVLPSGGRRWRKPVMIGVSAVLHVVLLGGLILNGIGDRLTLVPSPPPPLYIEIEPRPLLEDEQPRPRPAPAPASPAETRPAPSITPRVLGFRLPFQRDREEDEARSPSPPAPRFVAPAPGAPAPPAAAGAEAWQVRPQTMGDRVGQGLRTRGPGCASPQLLSREERAICEDRFGERAAAARPLEGTGNPERDARFAAEGGRALAGYEARRRPLAGGVGVVGPQDGPGSNFGMGVAGAHLDQSLQPDSTRNVRTRRDGDRASGQPLTPGGGFDRE